MRGLERGTLLEKTWERCNESSNMPGRIVHPRERVARVVFCFCDVRSCD